MVPAALDADRAVSAMMRMKKKLDIAAVQRPCRYAGAFRRRVSSGLQPPSAPLRRWMVHNLARTTAGRLRQPA